MPLSDYYSTPAQVRAMIATTAKLGIPTHGVVLPAPATAGPSPDEEYVNLDAEPADAMKPYALAFFAGDVDGANVAHLLRVATRPGYPPDMRAWELRCQAKRQWIPLDSYYQELEQIETLERAWSEKLDAILRGA